jgi:hypothetical protein
MALLYNSLIFVDSPHTVSAGVHVHHFISTSSLAEKNLHASGYTCWYHNTAFLALVTNVKFAKARLKFRSDPQAVYYVD